MNKIRFNTDDFDKKFKKIVDERIPELVERGFGRAMLQMMNDCIMEVPTVPLREGWLRGSCSVFVQNQLVATSEGMPSAKPKYAVKDFMMTIKGAEFVGVIGFNAPYAARLHEGVGFHFTEPSSGPKYLESKMIRNQDMYFEIVANTIKEGAR
jgi:hypothetical protein